MPKKLVKIRRRGHRPAKKTAPPTMVYIDFDDPKNPVSPDPVRVNPAKHEHIRWQHREAKAFLVDFKFDSPFEEFFFYPGKEDSGEALKGARGTYKYRVEVDDQVIDPKVIIDPLSS